MIQHILKILWNQRRINGWIFAELLIVTAAAWTLIDGWWVEYRTYRSPMGFDITNTWNFNLSSIPSSASGYVGDSLSLRNEPEALAKLCDRIRSFSTVEEVCITFYSRPYSSGNSWTGIYPANADSTDRQQSFQVRRVSPQYFDVFRINDTDGHPISNTIQGVHNPLVITQTMEQKFFKGEKGRGQRVEMDLYKGKEMIVAAVCNPIRYVEYERVEPSFFEILEGESFNRYVNDFGATSAELCVRMKRHYTQQEMNTLLSEMSNQLRADNLYVYGAVSLEQSRKNRLIYYENEIARKQAIMLFLLINVFFGIIGSFWLRTQNRRSEMGLRMALGSSRNKLGSYLYLEGLCLLLITVVPVLFYALNMIYLDKLDSHRLPLSIGRFLITFGSTYLIMGAMICIGIWFPSRRTMQIKPVEALRYE